MLHDGKKWNISRLAKDQQAADDDGTFSFGLESLDDADDRHVEVPEFSAASRLQITLWP